MADAAVHTFDTLRPARPSPPRPITNEPVSVHVLAAEETVLFGTGFASGAERLVADLEGLGGIDTVVVEHGDPDHYDALPALVEAFDPTVAIPAADASALADVGVEPDRELVDGDVVGGARCIHVPGHTPGNSSFLHPATGTLFAGDTVVHRNSFAAAPGDWSGALAPIKPELNDDDAAARGNVAVLLAHDFESAYLTHGLNVYEDARAEVERLVGDLRS